MPDGSSQITQAFWVPIWNCFSTKNSILSAWVSAVSACCKSSFGPVFGRVIEWIAAMVFGYSAQFSSGSRPFSLKYQANCLTQSGSSFLASGSGRGIFAIGDCNYITPQIRAHCNSFACYQESAAFTGCSSRWRPPSSSPSSSSGTWVALAATPAHPTSTSYSNCYYYSSRRRRFCHPRNCSHRRHHYYADR